MLYSEVQLLFLNDILNITVKNLRLFILIIGYVYTMFIKCHSYRYVLNVPSTMYHSAMLILGIHSSK